MEPVFDGTYMQPPGDEFVAVVNNIWIPSDTDVVPGVVEYLSRYLHFPVVWAGGHQSHKVDALVVKRYAGVI